MRPARRLLAVALFLAALPALAAPKLVVHFFDVGQGDSELIISPTGKTILIDAGIPDAGPHVAERLRALLGNRPLDLAIVTHPHLDHLGGMADAIRAVGAKRYMDDGFPHPSKAYTELLGLVAKEVKVRVTPQVDPAHPQDLIHINLGGGAVFTILWPRRPVEPFLTGTRSDPNANSIVGKLTYGKTAFLFVGDAEPDTEAYLLQKKINFRATVLKVGHHGSRHSSTTPWLNAIKPKVAVISCGAHNDYGHPGAAALQRLEAVGANIYRTDQDGEVTAVSDGTTVTVTAEKVKTRPLRVQGEVQGPVQLGPIVPGVFQVSQDSIESNRKYGRGHKSRADFGRHRKKSSHGRRSRRSKRHEQALFSFQPLAAPPPATTAPPSPDSLIPADVKARYPESDAQSTLYVASKHSAVFHRASCPAVARIRPDDRILFTSRAAAAADHRPAKDCHP